MIVNPSNSVGLWPHSVGGVHVHFFCCLFVCCFGGKRKQRGWMRASLQKTPPTESCTRGCCTTRCTRLLYRRLRKAAKSPPIPPLQGGPGGQRSLKFVA